MLMPKSDVAQKSRYNTRPAMLPYELQPIVLTQLFRILSAMQWCIAAVTVSSFRRALAMAGQHGSRCLHRHVFTKSFQRP